MYSRAPPAYQHKCSFVGKVVTRTLKKKTSSCQGTHTGPCIRIATESDKVKQIAKKLGLSAVDISNLAKRNIKSRQLRDLNSHSRYIDDIVIHAVNKLLQQVFPTIGGFEDTLYINVPTCRKKASPVAANIFYVGDRRHYVASVYASDNEIYYYDSLNPGSRPRPKVIRQFEEAYNIKSGGYQVKSYICQKQGNVDCAVYSMANIWCVLKGYNPSRVLLTENGLRKELLQSLISGHISFSCNKCNDRGNPIVYTYTCP